MAFDIVIGADAQPDTGFSIVIGTTAGGSAIDDTGYLLVRIPGGHLFAIRSPLRPSWVSHDELGTDVSFALDDTPGYTHPIPDPGFAFIIRQPHGWYEELFPEIAAIVSPPGPTLAAMQAGNTKTKWVCAIEGYENLLTDANTDTALTAWTGTGYTAALDGLVVRCSHEQRINPWNPFENAGGSLTIQMHGDSFGVDTHIKTGGNETQIQDSPNGSINCTDTTLNVKSAASFDLTGDIFVGTEAIGYSGQTATSFTGLTRGKYSPFLTESNAGLAHAHTISDDLTTVRILPVVSSTPRQWHGKWVGLWRHLYNEVNELMNVKSDALCTFAGRITDIRDNTQTLTTDVEVQHVLEYIRNAVLGENPWQGKIADGITLVAGMQFDATDSLSTSLPSFTRLTADPLIVVTGSPTSSYEIQEGRYQLTQIIGAINAWLDAAYGDAALIGNYSFGIGATADGVTRGRFVYRISTAGLKSVEITMPASIHRALGTFGSGVDVAGGRVRIGGTWTSTSTQRGYSENQALRSIIAVGLNDIGVGQTIALEDFTGDFFDQTTSAPAGLLAVVPPAAVAGAELGVCLINDKDLAIVAKVGNALTALIGVDAATGQPVPSIGDIPWDAPSETKIRQIFVWRGTFKDYMMQVLCSTGTAGFNLIDYDLLPATYALAVPAGLLSNTLQSLERLTHADQEITVIIDRPKKFIDIIGGAMLLRFAFIRWVEGGIEFYSWQTPTTGDTLDESNKASPIGNKDEQRSDSHLDDSWMRNVIKIEFDRDFTVEGESSYQNYQTIINRSSIDDSGGRRATQTISDATSYATNFLGGSGSVETIIKDFVSVVPMFTVPVRTSTRTIAPTMFEGLSVGDCVLVSDNYARDPSTGRRGIATRPGIVVAHSYEPGGTSASGTTDDMHGQVEVMFLDLLRVAPYVPAANLASYNAGTLTLTCEQHDNSFTVESADAVSVGSVAGRKIRIVERDPDDPAAPLQWDRIVASQSGNDIVLTAALSSPSYDATKSYRVIWDDYPDAVAAQQAFSYQADDADYLISDTRAPYQYVVNTTLKDSDSVFAVDDAAGAQIELPPDSSYGDGVGLDVGHCQALNRLVSNLYDYKTAASHPILFRTAITVLGDVTHDYKTVLVYPVFLGSDGLPNSVDRKFYVAPMWSSSTGSSINARITLSKMPPSGDSELNITLPTPSKSVTFTTTSTTLETATAQGISYGNVKDLFGVCYVIVEIQVPVAAGSTVATLQGIATSYQGPRE